MQELYLHNWIFTGKDHGTSFDEILKSRLAYLGVPFTDPCGDSQCFTLPSLPKDGFNMTVKTATHFNAAIQILLNRIDDLETRLAAANIP